MQKNIFFIKNYSYLCPKFYADTGRSKADKKKQTFRPKSYPIKPKHQSNLQIHTEIYF